MCDQARLLPSCDPAHHPALVHMPPLPHTLCAHTHTHTVSPLTHTQRSRMPITGRCAAPSPCHSITRYPHAHHRPACSSSSPASCSSSWASSLSSSLSCCSTRCVCVCTSHACVHGTCHMHMHMHMHMSHVTCHIPAVCRMRDAHQMCIACAHRMCIACAHRMCTCTCRSQRASARTG